MPKKISIINRLSKEELQFILDNSISYSEALRKLGYFSDKGGNYRTLKKRIQEDCLDLTKLNFNRKAYFRKLAADTHLKNFSNLENILVSGRSFSSYHLKNVLWRNKILEKKCYLCGLTD